MRTRHFALALLLAGACESKGDARHPVLLTTADFQALLAAPPASGTILDGFGVPGGLRLDRIIAGDAAAARLVTRDTFTHGYRSAYVTTEVWAGFDEVWVQPVYVPVTGYTDGKAARFAKPGEQWNPIFGVGPDSAFYSPYWQTIYFEAAATDDLATFHSVKDVLDRGVNLRPAEGHVMALVPKTVSGPAAMGAIGGPTPGTGQIDGVEAPFLDFGTGSFTWDDELVVEEDPLYVWVARDATGELRTLDIPTVGGSGPPYSHREPKVVGGQPKYGAYWRIYTVEVPPGMKVVAPPHPEFDALRTGLKDAGLSYVYTADYGQNVRDAMATEIGDWVGRVVTNPACLANKYALDPTNLGDPNVGATPLCVYLDSQEALEATVPGNAIHKTDILVTCPFVSYHGFPVTP